jgi:signal transduction histidine kinase/ligand-binding sensor domain-containing protein/DNA-binding response OmpR family regulator
MKNYTLLFLICGLLSSCTENANRPADDTFPSQINSNMLISTDISNQQITAFAEDSMGHIWIGTSRGLNKFNVHEFQQYFNAADSLSLCFDQISQIFRDSRNRLWVGTRNGICRYTDKDCFERIPIENFSRNVVEILEDSEGRIFLNMVEQLCKYQPEENRFTVVIPNFDVEKDWSTRCFLDKSGHLWAVSRNMLRCYETSSLQLLKTIALQIPTHTVFMQDNDVLWLLWGNTLTLYDTRNDRYLPVPGAIRRHPRLLESIITQIYPYSDSALLIHTTNGLFFYNPADQTVVYQTEDGFPFNAPNAKITTMFTDSQKNLWIGTADQGYMVKYNYKERFNTNNYLFSHFKNKSVTAVTTDKNGNLWLATSMDGVFMYHAENKTVYPIKTQQFLQAKEKFLRNRVTNIFIDNEGFLWLMSEMSRIFRCRYADGQLHLVKEYWLPTGGSFSMMQDADGNFYIAGFNENIYIMRNGETQFSPLPLFSPHYVFTNKIIRLANGNILLGAFAENLVLISDAGKTVKRIDVMQHIKNSVFVPTALFEDSAGNIWFGTMYNGLFRYSPKTGNVEAIGGTACRDICEILEDTQNNLWISTLFGLSKYDRATGKIVNYYKSDGIGGNQFNERSACRTQEGTLIFGGTHGLTFFNPAEPTENRQIPLLFENLKINNKLVFPYNSQIIDKHLTYNPEVRLKHNENNIAISYSALDYAEFPRVRFFFKMEKDGVDKEWMDLNNYHEAYFSNLSPGKYIFSVKMTNHDQTVTEAENQLSIIISPAPWGSWWAKCFYILLLTIFGLITYKIIYNTRSNKAAIRREQEEKEQEKRINEMNMSFFTNVSHEFRTPLTMISGPVMQLCNDNSILGENKKMLYIIQRSVNRMLKLVNQLLDFNKLDYDALKLQVKRTDIVSALVQTSDIFRVNAENKQINLLLYGLEDSYITWIDGDKLDKIVGNLFSNALKFTPAGGKIILFFDVISRGEALAKFPLTDKDISPEYVKIMIADSGRGIPADKLEKIFERYYQIIDQDKGAYNWGAGIGLYYARRLVELHHGYIRAANGNDGGATFTVILPVADEAYSAEEKEAGKEEQNEVFPLQTQKQLGEMQSDDNDKHRYKLLVVDDDTEVSHYLNTLLSPDYKVINRFDADSAMKAIEEEAPDLIISDVVMPGVSGYDFCRRIKENLQLCHIPVILVTAKTTVESQVEGLNTGADAYVNKPFDPHYLTALIKSQLKNRENVRNLLGKKTKTDKMDQNALSPQDKAFMTELYRLMETELSNTELNIARMTEVLKISRTKLYYKIKGLTGENPNVFFKTYKLNRAAELLQEGKYNISEIADITGFSTLSHFSTSFKKQFKVSPSEF